MVEGSVVVTRPPSTIRSRPRGKCAPPGPADQPGLLRDGLALVAVRTPPHSWTNSRTLSAAGSLTPTVPVPAVIASGNDATAAPIIVNGPGQKALAARTNVSDFSAITLAT